MNTILLLDEFNDKSKMLYESLTKAGFDGVTLVIDDKISVLPYGVSTIYEYFADMLNGGKEKGKPLHFDQITIPDYWDVDANYAVGRMLDNGIERGKIFFSDGSNKRFVSCVSWNDSKGRTRCLEHYNGQGRLVAKSILDANERVFCKTYFDYDEKELVYINYSTGEYILNIFSKTFIFATIQELLVSILIYMNAMDDRILINSFGETYSLCESLPGDRNDVIFYQGGMNEELINSLDQIINSESNIKKVYIQDKGVYNTLIEKGYSSEIIEPLGFIYDISKENKLNNNLLICTGTDNIESLEELVTGLPNAIFHIAASTTMSQKLLDFDKYENVKLYPACSENILNKLFKQCGIYLDINHEMEVYGAIKKAFLDNQLIVSFKDTVHNSYYIDPINIFENHQKMIDFIKELIDNGKDINGYLDSQRNHIMIENIGRYSDILKN